MERRARTVAPPIRPKVVLPETAAAPSEAQELPVEDPPPGPKVVTAKPVAKPKSRPKTESVGGFPMADDRKSNMSLQVRRFYDQRVNRLVFELNEQHGIRTSKVEIAEVAFSYLPDHPTEDLVAKVRELREQAPR